MRELSDYGQVLKPTSIIAVSSIASVLIGLIRLKIAAVILGSAGVGLMGLFTSLLNIAGSVAAIGIGNAGIRQIAEAIVNESEFGTLVVRRALLAGAATLALVGTSIFWSTREILATYVLGDPSLSSSIGWIAIGVGWNVIAGAYAAILNGYRAIIALAKVSVYSAALSTFLGIIAILQWKDGGLVALIIFQPFARILVSRYYVRELPTQIKANIPFVKIMCEWGKLLRFGSAFMVAGLMTLGAELAVKALIRSQLGFEGLGHFEAAWTISMTYVSLVLGAMAADYYPRLTSIILFREKASHLINIQTETALLLCGPVFLLIIATAPWIVELLYSKQFEESARLLQWQVIGDILKVASWPLGFAILSGGKNRHYVLVESVAAIVFLIGVLLALPIIGLRATGFAFVAMYISYLMGTYLVVSRQLGFRWSIGVKRTLFFLLISASSILALAEFDLLFGAIIGISLSLAVGLYASMKFSLFLPIANSLKKLYKRFSK